MKWTEKAIVTKPTGKRSSRKLEGKVAIILSQKINASYILPGNSFLFCLHWWSSFAKILCEIHIPALLVLPTLKVPVKKTIVQKNIKKSRFIWHMLQWGRWVLGLLPLAIIAAVHAVPVEACASGAQAEPCVLPTSLQPGPPAAELQCLHHMQ